MTRYGYTSDAASKDAPRLFYIFLLAGILMKDAIASEVLDLFVPYLRSEGSPIFKIHPGSYIVITLGILILPNVVKKAILQRNHVLKSIIFLFIATVVVGANIVARGETGGASYLIDSVLVCPFGLIALSALSPRQRVSVGFWILGLIMVNAVVVFAEFATHSYFLPHPEKEDIFRPPGLFNHPLRTGLNSVAALPCLFLLPISIRMRWFIGMILWLAIIVSQARIATLISTAFFCVAIPLSTLEAVRRRAVSPVTVFVLGASVLAMIPAAIVALFTLGVFERFSTGFADSSTLARVNIYRIFDYFSVNEILWGSSVARATYISTYALQIPIIESPIVVFIAMFGVFGAIIMSVAMMYFFISIAINAPFLSKLAVVAFLVLAFANNSIAQKGETTLDATVLMFVAATEGRRQRNSRLWLTQFAAQGGLKHVAEMP